MTQAVGQNINPCPAKPKQFSLGNSVDSGQMALSENSVDGGQLASSEAI